MESKGLQFFFLFKGTFFLYGLAQLVTKMLNFFLWTQMDSFMDSIRDSIICYVRTHRVSNPSPFVRIKSDFKQYFFRVLLLSLKLSDILNSIYKSTSCNFVFNKKKQFHKKWKKIYSRNQDLQKNI